MHWPRNWPNLVAMLHDMAMGGISLWLAHYLRLGDRLFSFAGGYLPYATPAFMITAMFLFVASGLYRGLWRYASMQDLVILTRSVTLVIAVFYFGLFLSLRLEGVPRSVPFIHWLALLAMLGAPRFAYRMAKDRRLGVTDFSLARPPRIPVLLIGANDAGEAFIRETRRNRDASYHVVGLVDDDPAQHGRRLHHARVYGGSDCLERIVEKLERKGRKPQRVVLAESRPAGDRTRQLLARCEALGLPLSRLPRPMELQAGSAEPLQPQPVAVEDLLRRAQNVYDKEPMRQLVQGKRVLVTGAGGSIGSELCRQLASLGPKELILFENSEYALYRIEQELANLPSVPKLVPMMGDVRNAARLEAAFAQYRPQLVFHAAALKHVPLSEENPVEAITTNVLGTRNVARTAIRHQAEAMVLISTDKAVRPTNVMGASKRLAELYLQALGQDTAAHGNTTCVTVRFGNVLGSTGSVVPLFQQQLAKGGPLTVTHPDITRYFMTIREAVELVIQAATQGLTLPNHAGGTFVLDMGEPVKIADLAQQMIKLAGLDSRAVEIRFTGLRPGEKLFEELFYEQEDPQKTAHSGIMLALRQAAELLPLEDRLDELAAICQRQMKEEALALLARLVPDYHADEQASPRHAALA